MKHVSILIPKGDYSIVNIMGSYQILATASGKYKELTGEELFAIDLVGFEENYEIKTGSAYLIPTKRIDEIKYTDLVLIPAVHSEPNTVIRDNQKLINFLVEQYTHGAILASLCIGAYLLAATGLLNGKICSTHWQHTSVLKSMFPKILVREERIITEQQGIITSGGAYAFTNLVLYIVEKYGGRELSVFLSKTFMIDLDRTIQSVYHMFRGEKDHADKTIIKVQEHIEKNFADKFTIDQLAEDHHLVRRTLERRFKSATGHSIIEYTQKVRIEAAKKDLEHGRKSVTEVMYDCGYTDPKAFRNVFKKYVGISPLEYRQKYVVQFANL